MVKADLENMPAPAAWACHPLGGLICVAHPVDCDAQIGGAVQMAKKRNDSAEQIALERITKAERDGATKLGLGDPGLTGVPPEIGRLTSRPTSESSPVAKLFSGISLGSRDNRDSEKSKGPKYG